MGKERRSEGEKYTLSSNLSFSHGRVGSFVRLLSIPPSLSFSLSLFPRWIERKCECVSAVRLLRAKFAYVCARRAPQS